MDNTVDIEKARLRTQVKRLESELADALDEVDALWDQLHKGDTHGKDRQGDR